MPTTPVVAPALDAVAVAALAQRVLDTHHALLHRELPALADALRVAPEAVRAPYTALRRLLDDHLWKEEQILFPAIFATCAGAGPGGCGLMGPIRQMGAEHVEIARLEALLRAAAPAAGAAADRLIALLDDLAAHARTEDEALFPAALALGQGPSPAALPVPPPTPSPTPSAEPTAAHRAARLGRATAPRVRHLGWSGLAVELGDAVLYVDPHDEVTGPIALTWSEQERVAGARQARGPLAAHSGLLRWLGRPGLALDLGAAEEGVQLGGFRVRALPYTPIPYATPAEALRKAASAALHPLRAAGRIRYTASRPADPPLALTVERDGLRVALLGQALHRFQSSAVIDALAAWAGPCAMAIAGTDYDDEQATAEQLLRFAAETRVVADLTGTIRRALGLPTRPLSTSARFAPGGLRLLGPADALVV